MKARLFGQLLPALEARKILLDEARPIPRVESVRVEAAFGRVAAAGLRAPAPVPAFARATWDGYAVRSRDLRGATTRRPRRLRVVGEVFAEQSFGDRIGPGEAVAIATGGAVPDGADAIEIFEQVRRAGPYVVLRSPVEPGARIAPPGDDFPKGSVLVRPGEMIRPATVGALAACGFERVTVFARPRVAIVPNGNELRPPGARLRPGQIYESNNASLSALVAAAGGEPVPRRPLPDTASAIEGALRSALRESDLVLATGGSSVGERDHLPRVFPHLGTVLFHGVAVRPGKPTLAARSGSKLMIGLPGHPTSCLLNMHWLVLPVLRRLARLPGPGWTVRPLRLASPGASRTLGLATVLPLRVEGDRATPTFRGSSSISSLRSADSFAILPPGRGNVRAGTRLPVCVLDPPLGPPPTG